MLPDILIKWMLPAGMYNIVMDKSNWEYGNANRPNVYYNEVNRNQLLSIRKADLDIAFDLIANNKTNEASNVLEHDDKMINKENLPYGMTSSNNTHNHISLGMLETSYRAGDRGLATKPLFLSKKICCNKGVIINH